MRRQRGEESEMTAGERRDPGRGTQRRCRVGREERNVSVPTRIGSSLGHLVGRLGLTGLDGSSPLILNKYCVALAGVRDGVAAECGQGR